jgi:phenylacetate-CoA ligase
MMLRKIFYLLRISRNRVLPRERIDAIQKIGLERIVSHANATVPYFERMFLEEGGVPRDRDGNADLHRIPVTRRADMSDADQNDLLSGAFLIEQLHSRLTGGTTGRPIDVNWDDALADLRAASLYPTYLVNGYRATDVIAVMIYLPTPPNPLRKLSLLRRQSVPYGIPIEEQMDILYALDPNVLEGYPSRLEEFASEVEGAKSPPIRPKLVFSNSEKLTPMVRLKLRKTFGVEPTDIYESWKFGNVGWECPRHQGFHVNEGLLKVELLEEDGTEAVRANRVR